MCRDWQKSQNREHGQGNGKPKQNAVSGLLSHGCLWIRLIHHASFQLPEVSPPQGAAAAIGQTEVRWHGVKRHGARGHLRGASGTCRASAAGGPSGSFYTATACCTT